MKTKQKHRVAGEMMTWMLDRTRIGVALLLAMLVVGVQIARGAEIIPSFGTTRAVHTDDNTSKFSGGLALRGNLTPFLAAEIGGSYRSEERLDGNLRVTQWPITASLWLKPVSMLYVGGGGGWYQTSLAYDKSLALTDETRQQFGVHLGGGVLVPLASHVKLDLNGRYVFLDEIDQKVSTKKLDPDFWTTSLGLAIKF
jgi:opacity protein-like surface antigen